MKNKHGHKTRRIRAAVERVRTLTNSGTRAHSPGLSTDVTDRVGRVQRNSAQR